MPGGCKDNTQQSAASTSAVATAGDGIGALTVSEDLTFNLDTPGTMAAFQILNASSADQIVIDGDLTRNASTFFIVTLDDDYVPASGDGWDLLDWGGLLWNIAPLMNGGSLTITIVPEPGRRLLLALGLMTLATRRRRI